MAKYRKKPVVVEAFQMTKERLKDRSGWPEWLKAAGWRAKPATGAIWFDTTGALLCGTLEGIMQIDWDDWIIEGVRGELYLRKPDIFEATYEKVT